MEKGEKKKQKMFERKKERKNDWQAERKWK